METKAHRFETAGLGKAPFRIVGVEYKVGPIEVRPGLTVGAPGQPMGCCDYCGQSIAECWSVRSSDGKTFTVGCDCVRKTGDAGLKVTLDRERRKLSHARDDARAEAAAKLLDDATVSARLAAKPHPHAYRAAQGATMLDWVRWMLAHAGRAGKVKAARTIEAARDE